MHLFALWHLLGTHWIIEIWGIKHRLNDDRVSPSVWFTFANEPTHLAAKRAHAHFFHSLTTFCGEPAIVVIRSGTILPNKQLFINGATNESTNRPTKFQIFHNEKSINSNSFCWQNSLDIKSHENFMRAASVDLFRGETAKHWIEWRWACARDDWPKHQSWIYVYYIFKITKKKGRKTKHNPNIHAHAASAYASCRLLNGRRRNVCPNRK